MRRREFLVLLGTTPGWPQGAEAQHGAPPYRIGLLADGPLQEMAGLREGLGELGYVEGMNMLLSSAGRMGDPASIAHWQPNWSGRA